MNSGPGSNANGHSLTAISGLWPDADRQRCTVHRLRNVLAKLPERGDIQVRTKRAY